MSSLSGPLLGPTTAKAEGGHMLPVTQPERAARFIEDAAGGGLAGAG